MDLHSRMQNLGGPIDAPSSAAVEADLVRGRQAVRRRRFAQVATGSAFSVMAVATAVALTVSGPGGTSAPVAAPPPAAVSQAAPGGVKLVAFAQEQPENFTIDVVPEGFFIQDQSEYGLMLAPTSAQNPGPDASTTGDSIHNPSYFGGKIGVYVQVHGYIPDDGKGVKVGTKDAWLRGSAGETRQVVVLERPKVDIVIQFDGDFGLTEQQMIEIAAGVHVSDAALDAHDK